MATTGAAGVVVHMDQELLAWVDRRRGARSRTEFVRDVLRERMARERKMEVRRTFDRAADVSGPEDIEERDDLISAFADRD